MFAEQSNHTAGHAEIYAHEDFVRPQVHVAVFDELRTYRLKHGLDVKKSRMEKGTCFFFRFHPTPEGYGFYAARDKPYLRQNDNEVEG